MSTKHLETQPGNPPPTSSPNDLPPSYETVAQVSRDREASNGAGTGHPQPTATLGKTATEVPGSIQPQPTGGEDSEASDDNKTLAAAAQASWSRPPAEATYPSFATITLFANDSLLSSGQNLDAGFPAETPPSADSPHPFSTHDVQPSDWQTMLESIRQMGKLSIRQQVRSRVIPHAMQLMGPASELFFLYPKPAVTKKSQPKHSS